MERLSSFRLILKCLLVLVCGCLLACGPSDGGDPAPQSTPAQPAPAPAAEEEGAIHTDGFESGDSSSWQGEQEGGDREDEDEDP